MRPTGRGLGFSVRPRRRGVDPRFRAHALYGIDELDEQPGELGQSALPIGYSPPTSPMMATGSGLATVSAAGGGGGPVTAGQQVYSLRQDTANITPELQAAKGQGNVFGLNIPVLSDLYRAGQALFAGAPAGTVVTDAVRGVSPLFGPLAGLAGQAITGGIQSPGDLLGALGGAYGGFAGNILGGLPSSILGQVLGSAVGQAVGGGPAGSPLAAMMGAGLGGVAPGTGPLPGLFGQGAQQMFGQSGFPPIDIAAPMAAGNGYGPQSFANFANQTSAVGRAIVSRVTGATLPQLDAIRQMIADRQAQIQATGEHRLLVSEADFRRQVLTRLASLSNQVRSGTAGGYAARF